MKIVVLSDLHLGVGDRMDRFGHTDEDVFRFLDGVEARADCVVLCGDVFETWQGEPFGHPLERLRRIEEARGALVERLQGSKYRWLVGNHDPILSRFGVPHTLEFEACGVRVVCTHGHQWDRGLKRNQPVSYGFSWLRSWMDQGEEGGVRSRLIARRTAFEKRFLWNASIPIHVDRVDDAVCVVQRGALEMLRDRAELDVVVCGHTHVPARCTSPYGVYLNSGACCAGRWSWVELDLKEKKWSCFQGLPGEHTALGELESCHV